MKKKRVYLDYAATTPVDKRVVRAMEPYWNKDFGNTMSLHEYGQKQAKVVERVRERVAKFIGADSEEIIFTSSATESNNLVIKGVLWANQDKGRQLVISAIEHDCVEESAMWMKKQGWKVDMAGVDSQGMVKMNELEGMVGKDTVLVSVIHGNNEMGAIQDMEMIGEFCRKKGILFHADASQSFGKVRIDVRKMKIDLLTASSHKIYGPKGVGVLYIRKGVAIEPILHGGGHESGLRSSTVNVPAIVGLGKAVDICDREMERENGKLVKLRGGLIDGILKGIKGTKLNGPRESRLSNNVNISFLGIEGESLLLELDRKGIAVSTGSACSSKSLEPSRVLMAMGLDHNQAHGSLRFSVGRWTKKEDIDYTLEVLKEAVKKLRKISPYD